MQAANLTTFKIGGDVDVCFPETEEELLRACADGARVFGNLSNTLVSSYGCHEKIVLTSKMDKFEIDGTKVRAQCGVKGPLLAQKTAQAGLSGFEFMIGFPGSVGGMLCLNASAHGQSISDTVISVNSAPKIAPEFGYRTSNLKNSVILGAEFELTPGAPEDINAKMQKNLEFRKTCQPNLALPNAGSIFKNPPGDSAGRLLDELKGVSAGGARVWENHANFIINTGGAISTDVLELMLLMYNKVRDKFDIELEPEIGYLGDNEKELEIWEILVKTRK